MPLSTTEQTNHDDTDQPRASSKRSLTILKTSSSLVEHNLTNSSTCPNLAERQSLTEPARSHGRRKPLNMSKATPSAILIENFKQQYKLVQKNASVKSDRSTLSVRRAQDQPLQQTVAHPKRPKRSRCCSCCFVLFSRCCRKTSKQIYKSTPNHSLTNEDDDDDDDGDRVSSNETSNRTPMLITSHSSLRTTDNNPSASPPSQALASASGRPANPTNDAHRRERIRFMKEQKTAKTLAVVVGGFILFWLPFFIMYIIPPQTYLVDAQTGTLITWLGYFNSVINPFIYAYCSKQFRMAFWNITFGMCIKKATDPLPLSVKTTQLQRHRVNA